MTARVTVSIVSHGQAVLAQRLLDDLARLCAESVDHVIVTSNLPEDWSPIVAHAAIRVTHLRNAVPRGFATNHNAAFRRCETPFFLIANPDIRLDRDPLPSLIEALGHPRRALATPRIVGPDGTVEDFERALLTLPDLLSRAWHGRSHAPSSTPATAWVAGMFMLVKSGSFAAIGGFDERFRLYCEDFDLCARLRLAGDDFVVVEDAVVVHEARRDSHRSLRHLCWHVQSLLKVWLSPTFWRYRALMKQAGRSGAGTP